MINKMQRKTLFSIIITLFILVDMLSTYLTLQTDGYRELVGLFVLINNIYPLLLFLYPLLWSFGFYYLYDWFIKKDFVIQAESIVLFYALMYLLSGIGNLYLYLS